MTAAKNASSSHSYSSASKQKPFLLMLQCQDETPSGSFRPDALVQITPALRTSGLLLSLSAEDLKSLLLVLTFAHPNGHITPSLVELSTALRQSEGKTRAQMQRLERFQWQGRPLLYEIRRESGLHAYAPSPRILGLENASALPVANVQPAAHRAAGREAVLAHSRASYARPRDEVEQEIARLNGWAWPFRSLAEAQVEMRQQALDSANAPPDAPTTAPEALLSLTSPTMATHSLQDQSTELRHLLEAWGVSREQAAMLLSRFDAERIRRQIEWLPLRNAQYPARFLVAAILHDYEAPRGVNPQDTAPSPSPTEPNETTDLPLP